jgi:hypothetical protein
VFWLQSWCRHAIRAEHQGGMRCLLWPAECCACCRFSRLQRLHAHLQPLGVLHPQHARGPVCQQQQHALVAGGECGHHILPSGAPARAQTQAGRARGFRVGHTFSVQHTKNACSVHGSPEDDVNSTACSTAGRDSRSPLTLHCPCQGRMTPCCGAACCEAPVHGRGSTCAPRTAARSRRCSVPSPADAESTAESMLR